MTFSNPKVVEFITANFVPAWINRAPGFHNEDYGAEQWIYSSSMEAYPTRNICTFVLAPDGQVAGYAAGYFCPEMFIKALEGTRDAYGAWKKGGMEDLRRSYGSTAERLRQAMGEPFESGAREYRQFTHVHKDGCAKVAREGLGYLAALYRHWSEAKELPEFEKIRFDYMWGNSFSEETRQGSGRIRGSCIGLKE